MEAVNVSEGDSPVVLAMPHVGTHLPDDIAARLNDLGRGVGDTDWWVDRLYSDLLENATVVKATFSRYVIDANRNPSGESLYPGQNTTGICPTISFDNEPIYQHGQLPSDDEIAERLARFHTPYHAALCAQLERVKARHGLAVLYDCHSIRSRIPFLFTGKLPEFNIGTADGRTCDARIEEIGRASCDAAAGYSHVINGRFKGGWTTRHYGQPEQGLHAIQMELTQSTYMDETAPWTYRPELAANVRPVLQNILTGIERLVLDDQF